MSQLGFVVQRDNEWRAVYAGGTADVYVNPKKPGGELNQQEKWNNEAVWIEFFS